MVPSGASDTWIGSDLVTPSGITADPAWAAGAAVGTATRLNAANEAAGTPPAAGFDPANGRHRVTYRIRLNNFTGTYTWRITREDNNTEVAETAHVAAGQSGTFTRTLEYDAAATNTHLYSVQITSYTSGSVDV